MSNSYAFVVPRVGSGIGGAETLVFQIAQKLTERGDSVKIFTTCALDNRTWENALPEGETLEEGVLVERFRVDDRDLEKWIPLQIRIHHGEKLSLEEELVWQENGVNSSSMYETLLRDRDNFDYFFFAPYLFATTFWGSLLVRDKAILIPCLHDESYAYTKTIFHMFSAIKGCIFNCEAERELASRLYGYKPGGAAGLGFIPKEEIQLEPYFEGMRYLLYLGRKETGKNAQVALDYFVRGKEEGVIPGDFKFVLAGPGSFSDLERESYRNREDIIDLPRISDLDKRRLLKYASIFVQPSRNESFSIVIMEAWQEETPCLVHGLCSVTLEHVEKSGGGLYFSDYEDFIGVLKFIDGNPELLKEMGKNGKKYVEKEYSWKAVLNRFDKAIRNIREEGESPAV